MNRLSRPQRLLLQLAFVATLLMVLAPLVSRALQSPHGHGPTHGQMDHASSAMRAHMHHSGMADEHGTLHAQPPSPPPADPHAAHGEACEYCVLAMRLLPWLAVALLLVPLRWRLRVLFAPLLPRLPPQHWPAHAARGPPLRSIVR